MSLPPPQPPPLLPSLTSTELSQIFGSMCFPSSNGTFVSQIVCGWENNEKRRELKVTVCADISSRQQRCSPSFSTSNSCFFSFLLFYYLVSLKGMHLFVLLLFCSGDTFSPPPPASLSLPALPHTHSLPSFFLFSSTRRLVGQKLIIISKVL